MSTNAERRVTALELFFDLVFVFGITQVTGYLGAQLTWLRVAQGLAIFAVLWWAWVAYAWVENAAGSDDGAVRVVLLAAMGVMLVVSLAVPGAFAASAVWFAAGLLAVRMLHLLLYWIVSRDEPGLRAVVRKLAVPLSIGPLLLVTGAVLSGWPRALCWILALLIDYTGPVRGAGEGSRVHPGHFAERFGLIVIIALGESIVSIGVGAAGLPLDAELILAALLGIAVCGALWWAYFDVVALVAERRFSAAEPREQVRIARDSYMYLHTPMVAGIVLFALGLKKTIGHVDEPLTSIPAVALCAGTALYLLALVAFRLRNLGTWNHQRLVAAGLLVAAIPLAQAVAALVALATVAVITVGLVTYETLRFAEARRHIRRIRP
jgi:low temperature requirement protein LtrA